MSNVVTARNRRFTTFGALLCILLVMAFPYPWVGFAASPPPAPTRVVYVFWGTCIALLVVGAVHMWRLSSRPWPADRGAVHWPGRIAFFGFAAALLVMLLGVVKGIRSLEAVLFLVPFVALAWLVAMLLPGPAKPPAPPARSESDARVVHDDELKSRGLIDEG